MNTQNLWFPFCQFNQQSKVRLFCFAHSGGSAQFYENWKLDLPESIELCSIQLPGRLNRYLEQPFTKMEELVREIFQVIKPYLDKPFAFFGHSLGALIAFELTRTIQKNASMLPCHLFVSAKTSPHAPLLNKPIHHLENARFIIEFENRYGPLPKEISEDKEFMEMTVKVLRADLQIFENYQYTHQEPINCPILALGGLQDYAVPSIELERWKEQTSSQFLTQTFTGDHFYLKERRKEVINLLVSCLSKYL